MRFNQLPQDEILRMLRRICMQERIPIEEEEDQVLLSIQKQFGSDIRSMINFLQLNQNQPEVRVEDRSVYDAMVVRFASKTDADATADAVTANVAHVNALCVRYNTDPQSLVTGFFHHVTASLFLERPSSSSSESADSFHEWIAVFQLLLDTDDLETDVLIYGFVVKMMVFFRKMI